jgi:hypothetical protein
VHKVAPPGDDIHAVAAATAEDPETPDSGPDADDGEPLDGESGPAFILISDGSGTNPCTFQTGGALSPTRVAHRADGSVSGEYNYLVQLMAPWEGATGPAELQLDRFSGLVLDAQFEDGADGTRYESSSSTTH